MFICHMQKLSDFTDKIPGWFNKQRYILCAFCCVAALCSGAIASLHQVPAAVVPFGWRIK